jgi:hypothetical protein
MPAAMTMAGAGAHRVWQVLRRVTRCLPRLRGSDDGANEKGPDREIGAKLPMKRVPL